MGILGEMHCILKSSLSNEERRCLCMRDSAFWIYESGCACTCVCMCVYWKGATHLFVFVGKWVFICMCLLTAGSVPGPAHLLASPNWWHHRNSLTRLFLIAAAVAAVTVAMRRPHSVCLYLSSLHTHTLKSFPGPTTEPVSWPSRLLDIMDVKMLIVTTVVMVVQGFKSIGM